MSEPKLISPMLDNFVMGDPISEHDGVRCCPAMEKGSDKKYIVKVISVPASQTQVDALLLSGACSDQEAALSYFKEISENITEESEILKSLSVLEGFLPIENWQIVPMEDGTGFDVYLLSQYRNTLQQAFRRSSMTHLSALNLGLDLCAALAVSRRSGYLYVDLKPGNIYLSGENTYRIGDIGFVKLSSLKYTSLPDRYRSQYTAPEITDAYASLNTTIDVYAVGLILYQAFNDGQLPFKDDAAATEEIPAPAYADYEMAEIILKACASDPADRWQDPIEMGQAIVTYMQRNGAHDTPIVPVAEPEQDQEQPVDESAEEADTTPDTPQEAEADDQTPTAEISGNVDTQVDEQACEPQTQAEGDTAVSEATEEICEDITPESIYSEDGEGNLTFLEDIGDDETSPGAEAADIDYDEVTDEVSDMLLQADELIAHEAPEPVVQPEPIDVPIPPPLKIEEESAESSEENNEGKNDSEQSAEDSEDSPSEQADNTADQADEAEEGIKPVKKASVWIRNTILIILALALIASGIFFYKAFYLQTIDSILLETSEEGVLTVFVNSQVAEDKLTVICTDTYGIQVSSAVVDGKAVFTDLSPNSAYTVKVVVAGFHRLTGDTSAAYTTPTQTEIVQFTAVTGTEDGSVILSFTIDGPDSDQWEISYETSDDTVRYVPVTGHMVTLTQLPIGQEFTFALAAKSDIHITGATTVTHTVSKLVTPVNLTVTSIADNTLVAQWAAPDGVTVNSWTVRCYNDSFDQTAVTQEPTASFDIPDSAASYTVEVTAAGMSVSERTYVAANSLSVKNFTVNDSDPNKIVLSWEPIGEINTEGWKLIYTADGSASQEIPVKTDNSVTISPAIPGCSYSFSIQTGQGEIVIGGIRNYNAKEAAKFEGYGVSADYMEFMMCRTPAWSNWDRYDVPDSDYTTHFSVGEEMSFLVRLRHEYSTSEDNITTLFVIRNENGSIVSTSTQTRSWTDMWYRNYCELDINATPQAPGSYTVSTYFNGQFVNVTEFTVDA